MKHIFGACICVLSAASCAHADQINAVKPSVCSVSRGGISESVVKNVTVLVTLDQHGGFATVKLCPERVLSIDFSQSNLFKKRYSGLLDQMQMNSMNNGDPTEISVSGLLRRKSGNDLRDTIIVSRIIKYRLR